MKKIVTKNMKKKQDRRNQLIIGFILIGLMLFSTAGFALSGGGDEGGNDVVEYNGLEFVRGDSGYWSFDICSSSSTQINCHNVDNWNIISYIYHVHSSSGNFQMACYLQKGT